MPALVLNEENIPEMQTSIIPKTDWLSFFASFSDRHREWLVELGVLGLDPVKLVLESRLLLEGLTYQSREASIEIFMGNESDAHITHSISEPVEVKLHQTARGADAAITIKSADGVETVLALQPGFLDQCQAA